MRTMPGVIIHGRHIWEQNLFPTDEQDKRLAAVQNLLVERNLDGLLCFSSSVHHPETLFLTQWFPQELPAMTLVPRSGAPLILGSAPKPTQAWFGSSATPSYDGDLGPILTEQGITSRIGVTGLEYTPAPLYDSLAKELAHLEIVPVDDLMRQITASLRPREITALRTSAEILLAAAKALVATKKDASDTRAVVEAEAVGREHGTRDFRSLFEHHKGGELGPLELQYDARVDGLAVYLAVEALGYWSDLYFNVGTRNAALEGTCRGAIDAMAAKLRPGNRLGDVASAAVDALGDLGASAAPYGFGGAIGLELDRLPRIEVGSTDTVGVNMALSLRVQVVRGDDRVASSRLVLVTDDGVETILDTSMVEREVAASSSSASWTPRFPFQGGALTAVTSLAERIATLRFEDLDTATIEVARQRIFDNLASFGGGAMMPEGPLLRRLAPKFSDVAATSRHDRLRYVCGAARCTEIDDIDAASCSTVGSIIVPTALETAIHHDGTGAIDGRALLSAVIAGYEAMVGFGRVVDGALRLGTGVWPTYLTAPIGAAGASARAFSQDAETTAHALAIAANRTVALAPRGGENSARWFIVGSAAFDGLMAARAAGVGMTGDLAVVEEGLAKALGEPFHPQRLSEGDDGAWHIHAIDAKPYRTARQALSPTSAFVDELGERDPHLIESVTVGVPAQFMNMLNRPYPLGVESKLGVHYQLALACVDPLALYDLREVAAETQPELLKSFMDRITVTSDDEMTAIFPRKWGAKVAITWSDGTTSSREMLDPLGSPASPLGWEALVEKHHRVIQASGSELGPSVQKELAQKLDELATTSRDLGNSPAREEVGALLDYVVVAGSPGL